MPRIYVPSFSPDDWRKLLAGPEKQWRKGCSARTIASSWQAADGFPPEVAALFPTSGFPAFQQVELLLAVPEHQVGLPPSGGHPSQNDVFALAKASDGGLMAITVEGKVSESFDKPLGEWQDPPSRGKAARLAFLKGKLGLPGQLPPHIRYQLLHRLASAVLEAERFNARYAAMIVHSFSQEDEWFSDFAAFLALFGAEARVGRLVHLRDQAGVAMYCGWARGEARFLAA